MIYDRQQMISTAFAALNIMSIHSPTAAIINYFIWGYVLPRQFKDRMEKAYG